MNIIKNLVMVGIIGGVGTLTGYKLASNKFKEKEEELIQKNRDEEIKRKVAEDLNERYEREILTVSSLYKGEIRALKDTIEMLVGDEDEGTE